MKLLAFTVCSDLISLESCGVRFDLHNSYALTSIRYDPLERRASLLWARTSSALSEPPELELCFSGVSFFKIRERDPEYPHQEDGCLEVIGFGWNDRITNAPEVASHLPSEERGVLSAIFHSAFAITVAAEAASFRAGGSV
jgi:hypothetical protein